MDCALSKALIGAFVGGLLALISLVAIHQTSDALHYLTAALYLASPFSVHLLASRISGSRCSIKEGIFLYLSITFISWIVVFNLVYPAFGPS